MGKKTRKTKKAELQLEPDGYSIHTLELSQQVSKQKWNWMKEKLYKKQRKGGAVYIYQNRERAGQYICIQYAYAGIRVLLEKFSVGEGAERFFARMVINPRKLIYPQSGYLGILPNEEESVELLGKAFHEVLKNSPFDDKISRYYLSRVDLCTNIRCNNKKVFRELVRLLRKTATPKKYRRLLYKDKNKKRENQYNKHFVRLACGLQELILYDKTYQMTANGLELAYAKLPDGVLRVEVHYGREKLRSLEKQEKVDDPLELLWLLMRESKERILGLVGKCYPELPYLSFEEGKTAVQESHYKDDTKKLKSGDYFYDAVLWAVEQKITSGTSATTFSPAVSCTRAQMVTFLWRAADSPKVENVSNPFTDVKLSSYYYDAVLWAIKNGVTSGTSATTFHPDNTVTRGQTVTFLYRNAGSPDVETMGSFSDVAATSYYAQAVAWAVKNGITTGVGNGKFAPDAHCTRAQIVTFLYRNNLVK